MPDAGSAQIEDGAIVIRLRVRPRRVVECGYHQLPHLRVEAAVPVDGHQAIEAPQPECVFPMRVYGGVREQGHPAT